MNNQNKQNCLKNKKIILIQTIAQYRLLKKIIIVNILNIKMLLDKRDIKPNSNFLTKISFFFFEIDKCLNNFVK